VGQAISKSDEQDMFGVLIEKKAATRRSVTADCENNAT